MSPASTDGNTFVGAKPLDAQTIPFIQPSFCADLFSNTTVTGFPVEETGITSLGFTDRLVTALVPDSKDPRFTACLSNGTAARPSQYFYTFSPVVSPSGWITHATGPDWERDGTSKATKRSSSVQQASTAYCCPTYCDLSSATDIANTVSDRICSLVNSELPA